MTGATLKRGLNYSSTYVILVKDYIAYLGVKAVPVVGSVVLAGLLTPLPFAIMAAAVYAMMAGHESSVIKIMRWSVEINVDRAFLCSLILAMGTLSLSYFANRIALASTTAWQTSLFWRAVNQLPVIARWDMGMAIPMPLRQERIGGFFNNIVRSGFLVGRIVAIGLSNFAIVVGGLIVLAWFDPISVAVLVLIAVLCLPLYAWALLRLVGVRERVLRDRPQRQAFFKHVLQEVVSGSGRRIDAHQLSDEDTGRLEAEYGAVNTQLQRLNAIAFIVGLQVFFSIAVIYLINGANLSVLLRDRIVFFVVLLFVMRASIGLAALFARLSRNYVNLATLRAYLHPRRKQVKPMAQSPANAVFSLAAQGEVARHPLCTGQPVFVVMPKATRAFELLPLSNALEILKMPGDEVLRYIVFLNALELQGVLSSDGGQKAVASVKVTTDAQSLQLPVSQVEIERERLGVVALAYDAWKLLVDSGEAQEFCRDRVVFIIIAEPKRPKLPSLDVLLIVSDCVGILAAGPFDETWRATAKKAFQKGSSKTITIDDDEEDA